MLPVHLKLDDFVCLALTCTEGREVVNLFLSQCTRPALELLCETFNDSYDDKFCRSRERKVPINNSLIWVTEIFGAPRARLMRMAVVDLTRLIDKKPWMAYGITLVKTGSFKNEEEGQAFVFPMVRGFPILTPGLEMAVARMTLREVEEKLRATKKRRIE